MSWPDRNMVWGKRGPYSYWGVSSVYPSVQLTSVFLGECDQERTVCV